MVSVHSYIVLLLEHHIHVVVNPITLDKQVYFLTLDYTTLAYEPNILVSQN